MFDEAGVHHCPAQASEVLDVCSANDTVVAVLAGLLASGLSCETAAAVANRTAGIVVGKLGSVTVSYDELFACHQDCTSP